MDVGIAAHLDLAVLEPHRPAAYRAVRATQQVQGVAQVRGREQTVPGAPGTDGGKEGDAQRKHHAAAGSQDGPRPAQPYTGDDSGEAQHAKPARQPHRPAAHVWLMRLAAAAAPNPLSMFTTVTPLAQELSMASSAAKPPNDAP